MQFSTTFSIDNPIYILAFGVLAGLIILAFRNPELFVQILYKIIDTWKI